MPLPQLWLVRHGQTEWSATGRHTGRTDLPLDDDGREQARALAPTLSGLSVTQVLTSPLQRARETCALAGYGERATVDDDLQEWDYGDYDGLTTEQIRERRPDWSLWRDGCPGGESAAQVGLRADRVIARVRAGDGDAIAFAHGHLLRVVAARWLGLGPEAGALLALTTATVSLLGWEREQAVVRRWNLDVQP
jgi:broad specificity phosphatase PhoE